MADTGMAVTGADEVRVLSSMATRRLLAELADAWAGRTLLEATGGVDAARRVRAGEPVDVVVLADAVMGSLAGAGFIVPASLAPIAVSSVAVAVRTGEALPDLVDAEAVRRSLGAGGRIGYSTGPSGDHLLSLLAGWGLHETLGDRLMQAPPGVPVGALLVNGTVDLAVQQLSELMGLDGVTIAGQLPPDVQVATVFTAGLATTARNPGAARRFIAALTSPDAAVAKQRHGFS